MSSKELLALFEQNDVERPVLTDVNSTSAGLDFVRIAQNKGRQAILGIDFRNSADQLFIGLAQNNDGYKELNTYLSHFLNTEQPAIPARAPVFERAFIIYPFEKYTGFQLKPNEFIGVRPGQLVRLKFSKSKYELQKMVALQTVTFRNKADFNAHRLLRAIDKNLLLSRLPKTEEGQPHHTMAHMAQLLEWYQEFPQIIENTQWLLNQCSVDFGFGAGTKNENQRVYSNNGKGTQKDDYQLVKKLCLDNLEYRYGANPGGDVVNRIEKELDIISRKGFLSYFLINWDLVEYARNKGYFYVGRGSGANSIIAYLLKITDVDPIELDLYFERFINMYRTNPPDFDIDFSWTDRDDVTNYIFNRFDNVALLGAYVTFQRKAVVRELGKVFGLPKHEIDVLSSGRFHPARLDKMSVLVLQYGRLIERLPNHCSVHSSGILISQNNLHNFSSTFVPPKNFPTVQFDMHIAEDVGLYKFDILSQRGLGKIKDALGIVLQNQNVLIDIHDIKSFKNDDAINDNLSLGKAIGAFYVESPAMRMLLTKLKVHDYLGLVAASSVIRPGVAKSGMMREYILRFRDPKRRKEANKELLQIMPETFGVMVYQEDVIKVAHLFADLTLAEADVLRRGMSGKFRSRDEFQMVKQKYFDNCRNKGYSNELAAEVWRQIESFAGFAFAKGHSASYAVESYQSLYLKTHFPLEFLVAVLNNGGGFYGRELYVHEARMLGAEVHPPCINRSGALTTIKGNHIYLGLGFIKELEGQLAIRVEEERYENGPFKDFDDFIDRLPIGLEQAAVLIRVDAFRFTGINKRELLWEAHFKLNKEKKKYRQEALFKLPHKKFEIPKLTESTLEDAFDHLELLGFALCHPFELLTEQPERHLMARGLKYFHKKQITIWGYLVNSKNTTTNGGRAMNFGTFLDYDGYFFDTTHFPVVAAQFPFRGKGVYEVTGIVEEEFGHHSIEVQQMRKIDMIPDPRYSDSEEKVPDASIMNFLKAKAG